MDGDTLHTGNAPTPLRKDSYWRWELTAILLVLVAQMVYFTGVIASDDYKYISVAWRLHAGESLSGDSYHTYYTLLRFVHWGLMYLSLFVWANPTWACVMPSMLASLMMMLVLRSFARRYVDARMGAVAILIYGMIPMNVAIASIAVPEPISAAFAWLGVYLVSSALLQRETRRANFRCLIGGLLIGVGYSAKVTVASCVPSLMLFVLVCRTRQLWAWGRAALIALGAGFWVIGEMLIAGWLSGDPFLRAHIIANAHRRCLPAAVEHTLPGLLSYGTEYLRWLADPHSQFGPMGLILLAGLTFAILRRNAVHVLLLCIIIPSLIYLSLGSTDLGNYRPVLHSPRYLIPVLPGLALMATGLVWLIWKRGLWIRRAVIVAGVFVVLLSLNDANQLAGRWYYSRTFAAGYEIVDRHLAHSEPNVRVCAAYFTWARFSQMHLWQDCPKIEIIEPTQTCLDDWIDHYGGAYVFVTRSDYRGSAIERHADRSLHGTPHETLTRFERIARVEPPRDRLSTLRARLLGEPVPTDPNWAVELWRVPTRQEFEASKTDNPPKELASG